MVTVSKQKPVKENCQCFALPKVRQLNSQCFVTTRSQEAKLRSLKDEVQEERPKVASLWQYGEVLYLPKCV